MHTDFPSVLCRQFTAVLLRAHADDDPELKEDPTYYNAIARWISWVVQTWGSKMSSVDLKKDVIAQLLKGLGCNPSPKTTKSM